MDIYRDYFTREQLLLSLSNTQYVSHAIGSLNLFETVALTGLTAAIEELPKNSVAESAEVPRGSPGKPLNLDRRVVKTFSTKSYAWQGAVLADEVLNMRTAGTSGAADVFQQRRNDMTNKLRRQADFQFEYLRLQCLLSPNNDFGTAPSSQVIAFGSTDSATRTAILDKIMLPLETALDGLSYTGLVALCDDTFWKGLIESKTIKETYLNYAAAAELRNAPSESFSYGGVTWMRHRASGNIKIPSNTAKIIPQGVSGLFLQLFSPNDTMSSVGVGALGQPYYLDAYPLDDDKGYRMTLQTHPLALCTRPSIIQTVTLS